MLVPGRARGQGATTLHYSPLPTTTAYCSLLPCTAHSLPPLATCQAPPQLTQTTAEPRPNAYIPDDIGIPKPYGGQQPFKPSELGTTMRHTRKPQPREIEL